MCLRCVVIDAVLVAERNPTDPLGEQGRELVDRPPGISMIDKTTRHAIKKPDLLGPLTKQQNACIRGDLSAVEGGEYDPRPKIRKPHSKNTL